MATLRKSTEAALRAALQPGERLVAIGPQGALSEHRLLMVLPAVAEPVELPLASIREADEGYEAHRPTLRLRHDPITYRARVPKRFLLWTRGDRETAVERTEHRLSFSRRDTDLIVALREALGVRGIRSGRLAMPPPAATGSGTAPLVAWRPRREWLRRLR